MEQIKEWPKLFESGRIGQMSLRNRIVMAPLGTHVASLDGQVTDQLLDYYEARAKGGTGLVIVEAACVDAPVGKATARALVIDDDSCIPGLSKLAEVIKRQGACAAVQLHHAGIDTKSSITGQQAVGPSAIRMPSKGYETARELSVDEIGNMVGLFTNAAIRARKAGFNAVEIHAAHSYLLAEFISSAWNMRSDQYGGELENRARLLIEIIKEIKETVGSDFAVWPRINGIEYGLDEGLSIEESKKLARMVEEAGADAVHISCLGWGSFALANMPEVAGAMLPLAREITTAINIPLIAVGRITADLAEQALTEGWADFIALGRALLADPDYATKLSQGRAEDIIPCIACNYCLHSVLFEEQPVKCSVNPALGQECEYIITPALKQKKVLIVGGGPAGMEAARMATLRGHKVMLCDKSAKLGGQLDLAVIPTTKRDRIGPLACYLIKQIEKLDVEVRLDTEVTEAMIKKLNPDAVVLACGIKNRIPQIAGVDRPNVVSYEDILLEKVVAGNKVAIIGGELVGCETAEVLAEQGKQVTIMRRGQRIATKVLRASRPALLRRLRDKGVVMLTEVSYEEITDNGVVITTKEGEREMVEADTVVLAAGADPNKDLQQALEGKIEELFVIGDALEPRGIREAIVDGARIGRIL